jgi:hypothetical protein
MVRRTELYSLVVAFLAAGLAAGCTDTPDQRPVLGTLTATTNEDTPVDLHVLDKAQDAEGDSLEVVTASAPGAGVEVIDASFIRFTPAKDFHGTVDVSFTVSDGHSVDGTGIAIVTVLPVNDAPVATSGTLSVRRAADIALTASDVDGDPLSFTIASPPSHGTLTGKPPQLHYAADSAFVGDDSFTFQVSDGQLTSAPATITLHIDTADAAPIATSTQRVGIEDMSLFISLSAFDPDGDALTYTIEAMPQHGTISGAPPNLTYQPVADFNGDDALQFSVSDGIKRSEIATVAIHVTPVNDAPVATSQTVDAFEDTPLDIPLALSDADGDPLTIVLFFSSHGTVTFRGTTATFAPAANFHGTASFTYLAFDGLADSQTATVTINIASVNDAPVANSQSGSINEDAPTPITLTGSDVDGDMLTFAVTTQPQHGTLTGTPPQLTYTPAADYNGPDSFTFTASDGNLTSAPATISINIRAVNDPPVPQNATVTTDEDTPVTVTLQATDVDSPTVTFSIATPPPDGTVTLSGTSMTYTPALNATGQRTVTFRVSDGLLSATGTVTINITPENDPPIVTDDYVATDPGVPLTIDAVANDVEPDGDAFQIDSFDQPANGTVELIDGKLLYTGADGFTGIDVFRYTVSDAHGAASTGQIHVGVGEFPPGGPTETLPHVTADSTDRDNAPTISNDGRFIAFTSFQALTDDDTNGFGDVYVYDRGTRALKRISVASDGTQGNATSQHAQISGNGEFVVYESTASNLVAGDTNGVSDVFRYDRVTGETIRISIGSDGSEANGASSHPVISDDGAVIAFASAAFNLVAGDANGASDVFVRDFTRGAPTTSRISISVVGGDGDLASSAPAISGDGRSVAFVSSATNLIMGDTNNASDVFVRNLGSANTTLVSQSTAGMQGDRFSNAPAISGDGRFVSFVTQSTNLVQPPPTVLNELYVRDVTGRVTTRPSPASLQVIWGRLSGDGRYLVQMSATGVQVIDRFTPSTMTLNTNTWFWPVVSGNGRYIVVSDRSSSLASVTVTSNPL